MNNGLIFKDMNLTNSFLVDDYYIDSIVKMDIPLHDMDEIRLDDDLVEKHASYLDLYKHYLKSLPMEKRLDIIYRTSSYPFVENVRNIYRVLGNDFNEEALFDLLNKNPFLLGKNMDWIISNYEYIQQRAYLSSGLLKQVYYSDQKSLNDKLSLYIKNREVIPNRYVQLAVPSDDSSLDEVDKNIRYIVSSYGIRSFRDLNSKRILAFDNTLFENKVHFDDSLTVNTRFIQFSQYEKYFRGVKQEIVDLLEKISPNFIDELDDLFDFSDYRNFIENMDVVRRWNSYDNPMERANEFKDEFITKVLFGTFFQSGIDYQKEHPELSLKKVIKEVMDGKVPLHINEDALKLMNGDTIKDICSNKPEVLRSMDKFIGKTSGNAKGIIYRAYMNSSKLFGEENPYYEFHTDSNDVNVINNDLALEFSKDPYFELGSLEKRERIVNEMYESMREYPHLSKRDKDFRLREMFQTIHYYMVNNEEYTIQNRNQSRDEKKDVRELAHKMFSANSNKYNLMDRLFYCAYNSNRLAHSEYDVLRKIPIRDSFVFRYDTSSFAERYMADYNDLHQYGFSVDYLNEELDKYFRKQENTIFNKLDLNSEEFLTYVNQNVLLFDKPLYKLDSSNVSSVMDNFRDVLELNNSDDEERLASNRRLRDQFRIYAKEENMFFELKRFFIDEAERRMTEITGKDISTMTADEKREFLESNGYFIEFQPDDNHHDNRHLTMVVYDKKFNAPFAVHYIANREIDEDFVRREQLITHTFNHNGLTEKVDEKKFHMRNNSELNSMFLSDTSKGLQPLRNTAETENMINISMVHHSNKNDPDKLMDKLDEMNHLKDLPIEFEDASDDASKKLKVKADILTRYNASRLFLLGDIYSNEDVKVVPLSQMNLFDNENKLVYKDRSVVITDREKDFLKEMFPNKHNDDNSNKGPNL